MKKLIMLRIINRISITPLPVRSSSTSSLPSTRTAILVTVIYGCCSRETVIDDKGKVCKIVRFFKGKDKKIMAGKHKILLQYEEHE